MKNSKGVGGQVQVLKYLGPRQSCSRREWQADKLVFRGCPCPLCDVRKPLLRSLGASAFPSVLYCQMVIISEPQSLGSHRVATVIITSDPPANPGVGWLASQLRRNCAVSLPGV